MPEALRLALARAAAWLLFVGAWLQLGQAGQAQLPLWAGGLLPLALWLALCPLCAGACRAGWPPAALRGVLAGAAGLAALGLGVDTAPGLLLAAAAWAALVVAASQAVRRLRPAGRGPAPLLPATLGVAAAGLLASRPGWVTLLAGGLLLALLLPRRWAAGARAGACSHGLIEMLWPGGGAAAPWPLAAARWTMLPMMAMLPLLAQWCSAAGIAPGPMQALHLGAMLAPAWLVRALRPGARFFVGGCAVLLLAGAAAPWVRPGLAGLMAASLLHTLAWGLAWAAGMTSRPAASAPPPRPRASTRSARALLPAALLLALGTALALFGPPALVAVHGLFALPALVALAALARTPVPLGSG